MRADVASYLKRHGWSQGAPGLIGELWRSASAELPHEVAVPYELEWASSDFRAVASRIALSRRVPMAVVVDEIEREFQDVQNYRVRDGYLVEDAVLLEGASTILLSARRLLRAAATTARKPRPAIGANYSPPGDALASQARLAHTKRGSFVLPVVMPVEPPEPLERDVLGGQVVLEPAERRVTRTLATAIAALDSIAIKAAKEPGLDEVVDLVQSGVSRELVAAVRAIAVQSGVDAFDATFAWAPGLGAPGGLPERVVIEDEASQLLERVEGKLRTTRSDRAESVSGQIVEIRHVPDEPLGEVAIRTIRKNRNVEIRVTATEPTIRNAFDWAKQARAVIARGRVVSAPGRPLSIPHPEQLMPIDALFADSDKP